MLKVLVVEDDMDLRHAIVHILKSSGYAVFPAAKASHAIDLVLQENPDLLLLDLMLPDQRGADIVKKLKHKNPNKLWRIIF